MSSNVLLKWTFGPSHAVLTLSGYAITPVLPRDAIYRYGNGVRGELLTKLAYLIGRPWINPQTVLTNLAMAEFRRIKCGELRYYERSWFEKDRVAVADRGTEGGLI